MRAHRRAHPRRSTPRLVSVVQSTSSAAVAQPHHAVGDVAAHAEQRQRRRRTAGPGRAAARGRAEMLGLRRPRRAAAAAGARANRASAAGLAGQLARLHQPVGEDRVAGVLDVVAAPGRPVAVDRVGDPDGAGDHRARGCPRAAGSRAVGRRGRVSRKASRSPLPLNRVPSGRLRPGQRGPVAQQQVGRAERARAQHQPVAGDRVHRQLAVAVVVPVVGRVVHDVADLVAAAVERRDAADLAAGADVGAVVRPRRTGRCGRGCSSRRRCSRCRTRRTAGRCCAAGRGCCRTPASGSARPARPGRPAAAAKLTASGGSCQSQPEPRRGVPQRGGLRAWSPGSG